MIEAAFVGAFVTFGIILLVVLPMIVVKWLVGDWASGEYCDGFCMTNTEGFLFALFILTMVAVPAAVAGGTISAIASLAGLRRLTMLEAASNRLWLTWRRCYNRCVTKRSLF